MSNKPIVLLVDDRSENLITLEAVLESLEIEMHKANSADTALRFLLDNEVAVILLDVEMPKIDGFETARLIRERPRSRNTPIIFITAIDGGQARIREGYKLGAVDYLVKPFQPDILRWKVSVFIELHRSREQERLLAQEQIKRAEAQASARRAELLSAAAASLASSMEEDTILERLAQRLVEEFADSAALFRPESEAATSLQVTQVFQKNGPAPVCIPVVPSKADPVARAFHGGRPVLTERLSENLPIPFDLQSGLCLPLCGPRNTLGVLALYRRATNPFTDLDLALARELTDRIELALTNVALYKASEDANRAKDQFLAVVSHELRTPLVSILGWANILLTRKVPPEAAENALKTIQRNAKLQRDLINDILDFSRIATRRVTMEFKNVDLRTVIEQVIDSIVPVSEEKRVRVVANLGEVPAVIVGDPVRLQQLFTNLLSNAIKFTPEHGEVMVMLETAENSVQVQVTDTGIGIDPAFLPRVFEPFAQEDSSTTRAYSGLGLGLAIVRRLTELHNGSIRVESAGRGKGSTFILNFPARSGGA